MRYIEIAEGLSIKIDEIEAIGKRDELMSIVYTHHNSYDSTFPYNVLLELLEKELEAGKSDAIQQKQLKILETIGNFSG